MRIRSGSPIHQLDELRAVEERQTLFLPLPIGSTLSGDLTKLCEYFDPELHNDIAAFRAVSYPNTRAGLYVTSNGDFFNGGDVQCGGMYSSAASSAACVRSPPGPTRSRCGSTGPPTTRHGGSV